MRKNEEQCRPSAFGHDDRCAAARRCSVAGLVVLVGLIAAGCGNTILWQTGRPPDTRVLEEKLVLGRSTIEEVKAVLGEPNGDGGLMSPTIDRVPRKMISYGYEEGTVSFVGGGVIGEIKHIVLNVYIKDGRFDGYQWFSSFTDEEWQERLQRPKK